MQEKYLLIGVVVFVVAHIIWDWLKARRENGKKITICPLNQAGTIQAINEIKSGMGKISVDMSTVKYRANEAVDRQKTAYSAIAKENSEMLKVIRENQMIQQQTLDDLKVLASNLKTMSDTLIRLNGLSRK